MTISEDEHGFTVEKSEKEIPLSSIHGEGVKIKVYEITNKQVGGADAKSHIVGRFVSKDGFESSENIPMFVKQAKVNEEYFGGEKEGMSAAERYFERWKFLRDLGVPVVPNVVVLDGGRVAMTNLGINGSEFFGKAWRHGPKANRNSGRRELSKAEQAVLSISDKKVMSEMARIRDILVKEKIRLPYDDPFDFLVHPDGSFEILVHDPEALEWGEYDNSKKDKEDPLLLEPIHLRLLKEELEDLSL